VLPLSNPFAARCVRWPTRTEVPCQERHRQLTSSSSRRQRWRHWHTVSRRCRRCKSGHAARASHALRCAPHKLPALLRVGPQSRVFHRCVCVWLCVCVAVCGSVWQCVCVCGCATERVAVRSAAGITGRRHCPGHHRRRSAGANTRCQGRCLAQRRCRTGCGCDGWSGWQGQVRLGRCQDAQRNVQKGGACGGSGCEVGASSYVACTRGWRAWLFLVQPHCFWFA